MEYKLDWHFQTSLGIRNRYKVWYITKSTPFRSRTIATFISRKEAEVYYRIVTGQSIIYEYRNETILQFQ